MVVPVPLWVTDPVRMLPVIVALPEPEFRKAPLPSARLLEITSAPALVLVRDVAVMVPPPRDTVPVLFETIMVPAVRPPATTEIPVFVTAASPKAILSPVKKAILDPAPFCCQLVALAFVDHWLFAAPDQTRSKAPPVTVM